MKGFELKQVNSIMYRDILNYIELYCFDFEVVQAKDSDKYDKFPQLKKQLAASCLGYKYVKKWEGTKGGGGIMHVYACNHDSISVLKQYSGFFDYDLDVAFYKNGRPMLYTISHEKYIAGIFDYWNEFLEQRKPEWGNYTVDVFSYFDDKYDDDKKKRTGLKVDSHNSDLNFK